jgi:hypothetical protein
MHESGDVASAGRSGGAHSAAAREGRSLNDYLTRLAQAATDPELPEHWHAAAAAASPADVPDEPSYADIATLCIHMTDVPPP